MVFMPIRRRFDATRWTPQESHARRSRFDAAPVSVVVVAWSQAVEPWVLQVLRPLVLQDQVRLNGLGHLGGRWPKPDTHGLAERPLVGSPSLGKKVTIWKIPGGKFGPPFFFESVAEMNTVFCRGEWTKKINRPATGDRSGG